ncbi:hypothetical protein [uncultured Thiodictyon sp.]|uniref:hypothetical protein n=1 Tax=uncultured Thiodictyon sp. TaxID=1846217 RepID=UPI0025FF1764|nr:hypothetical protein [uncultured Thiodictyon sp.]
MNSWAVGDWVRHARHTTPCRVVDRQTVWGETVFRVWLPRKRVRRADVGVTA